MIPSVCPKCLSSQDFGVRLCSRGYIDGPLVSRSYVRQMALASQYESVRRGGMGAEQLVPTSNRLEELSLLR